MTATECASPAIEQLDVDVRALEGASLGELRTVWATRQKSHRDDSARRAQSYPQIVSS
jgi:hypothetical protein